MAHFRHIVWPSKTKLEQMYSQGMSILQISQELKLVPNRIKYYLKNYGIKTRSKLESQAFYKHAGVAIEVTKPQLEQWYIVDKMSTYDISKKIGHAQQTVSRYLKKYQIPMRVYTPKLTTLPLEKIKQLYFEQKLDSRSIGEIVGCSAPTICEILKRNKYLMRDPSEIGGCGLNRKVEQELLKFNYQFETNCRSQIHSPITTMPLELDFYFPTQKLAIEVNGDYWHSDKVILKKNKMTADQYHNMKLKLCKDKGIDLIFIWEHDWNNDSKRQVILKDINQRLNKYFSKTKSKEQV